MRIRAVLGMCIIFIFATFAPSFAASETLTSQQLLAEPSKYDQNSVVYEGEAVGDIMQRKDGQWVNVLNTGVAIGVWSTKNIKGSVSRVGDYNNIGDQIRVTGRFNWHCPEHGGDLDIHASELIVVSPGKKIDHKINIKRLQAAILLTIGAMLAFGFNISRSRRYL